MEEVDVNSIACPIIAYSSYEVNIKRQVWQYSNQNSQIQNLHGFLKMLPLIIIQRSWPQQWKIRKCKSLDKDKILDNRFNIDIIISFR